MPAPDPPPAPDGAVLLVVDMLDGFDGEGGAAMRQHAQAAAERIAAPTQSARAVNWP